MAYVIQDIFTGEQFVNAKLMFVRRRNELESEISSLSTKERIFFYTKEFIKVENHYKENQKFYKKESATDKHFKSFFIIDVLNEFEYFLNFLIDKIEFYDGFDGLDAKQIFNDLTNAEKEKNKNKVYALLEHNKLDWQSNAVDLMRFIVLVKFSNKIFEKIEPIKLIKQYCTRFGNAINSNTIKQEHSSVMKKYSPNNNVLQDTLVKRYGSEGFVKNKDIIFNFLKLHI